MVVKNHCEALKINGAVERTASKWQNSIFCLLCFSTVIYILCVLILASVPPISRDALIHHLAIPKMYLSNGGIYEIPSMIFSYYPMNLDLLYLLPLYFKNDIAAKYIHFLFALLTAGLLYLYLKNALNRTYGLIGAFFFLSIPVIVKLSVTVYVDLGLIFFSWACLYYFLKWIDTPFSLRYFLFSSVSCGLALGTKYNGLILLFIMAALVSIVYSVRQNNGLLRSEYHQRYKNSFKGLLWGSAFTLIALIIFSPWMIRNTIWKHNPVYPLFNSAFNPPEEVVENAVTEEQHSPQNAFWMRKYIYKESFVQTIFIPIRAFFQGRDDNPKYFDGKLNPFLLLLPLLSFVCIRDKRLTLLKDHRNFCFIFAMLFILFVFFESDFRIRYMAPAIPPLVVLSVFGIKNMVGIVSRQTGGVKRAGWGTIIVLMLFAFFYNANYIYGQFDYIRPLDYIFGKVDRDAYIGGYRMEYPVIHYANLFLPKDARVLCLSIGDRTYYIDREAHLAEDFYDKKDGKFTENDLLQKISRYGSTHIIFYKNVYLNWARHLSKDEQAAFENVFQNHTKLLYEKNDVQLLELI